MKLLILLPIFLLSGTLGDNINSEPRKYTTKYDNVDIEEVVKNDRLLKSYVDCLLGSRGCTPDGVELKKNMPDAIATNCSKCSEKQKEGSKVIIGYLIDNKPEYWGPLEKIYDPSGNYTRAYLEEKEKDNGVNIEPVTPDKDN